MPKQPGRGTTVSERVRAGLREYVYGPEARHTIADSFVYLVPDALEDLKGRMSGTVQLPIDLDWGLNGHTTWLMMQAALLGSTS